MVRFPRFKKFYDYEVLEDIVARYDIITGDEWKQYPELVDDDFGLYCEKRKSSGRCLQDLCIIWISDGLDQQEYDITMIHEFLHVFEYENDSAWSADDIQINHDELEEEAIHIVNNHYDLVEYVQSFYN